MAEGVSLTCIVYYQSVCVGVGMGVAMVYCRLIGTIEGTTQKQRRVTAWLKKRQTC